MKLAQLLYWYSEADFSVEIHTVGYKFFSFFMDHKSSSYYFVTFVHTVAYFC